MTSTIANITPFSDPTAGPASRTARREMGRDEFLKLLTVQLANQDPLKPMDDTAFIAQMAQFSTLEQSTQLNRELGFLRSESALSSGASLLGREVTVSLSSGEQRGVVEAVESIDGAVHLRIGEELFPFATVTRVAPPTPPVAPETVG